MWLDDNSLKVPKEQNHSNRVKIRFGEKFREQRINVQTPAKQESPNMNTQTSMFPHGFPNTNVKTMNVQTRLLKHVLPHSAYIRPKRRDQYWLLISDRLVNISDRHGAIWLLSAFYPEHFAEHLASHFANQNT